MALFPHESVPDLLLPVSLRWDASMTLELSTVTFDCVNPRRLAEFWSEALDFKIVKDYSNFVLVAHSAEGGKGLAFQRVPNADTVKSKNKIHLDLRAVDRGFEVKRLVGLGASEIDEHSTPGLDWTVLTDPEGNVFCVGEATSKITESSA